MTTVIRAGEAGPILKRLSTVDLADHLAEARAVVEKAERRVKEIATRAEEEAKRLCESSARAGYDKGYESGYVAGRERGEQTAHDEAIRRFESQYAGLVTDMERVIDQIGGMKDDLRIAAERDLLEFAVLTASKLTFAIGKLHRESAMENIRRALRLVEQKTDINVRVNSADVEAMKMFVGSTLRKLEASRTVQVVKDESLAPGGCVVESDRTCVDAALETQVDEMVALLLGAKTDNV